MNSPYNGKFRVSQTFKGVSHDGLDLVGIDSKEVHSTINGIVEKAGWENPQNPKQGFGLYVRIRKEGSIDKYYFGHLSKLSVTSGQTVKIGDVIGIEGSTGNSTGSHCHYCARGNGAPNLIRDIPQISGIPNKLGTYDDGYLARLQAKTKTVSELADEVIAGKWGNGADRKTRLAAAGYNYAEIQKEVNRRTAKPKKSNQEIATEVVKGIWGNGEERKKKLTEAGYNYKTIQQLVNKML